MKNLIKKTFVLSAMLFAIPTVIHAQTELMQTVSETSPVSFEEKKYIFHKNYELAGSEAEVKKAFEIFTPEEIKLLDIAKQRVFEDIKQKENDEKAMKIFDIIDIDADGFISKEEFINFHRKVAQKKEEKMKGTNNSVETYKTETVTETSDGITTETTTETVTESSFSE